MESAIQKLTLDVVTTIVDCALEESHEIKLLPLIEAVLGAVGRGKATSIDEEACAVAGIADTCGIH